jgi:hypothetical protein
MAYSVVANRDFKPVGEFKMYFARDPQVLVLVPSYSSVFRHALETITGDDTLIVEISTQYCQEITVAVPMLYQ